MKFLIKIASIALGSSLLAGLAFAEGDAAAGEKIFKRCGACHMVGPNAKKRIGPVLNGVFGRKAGTWDDFKYSPVMVALGGAGLVWNPKDFAGYVGNPRDWLSTKAKEMGLDCAQLKSCRNTMAFAGLKKQQEIDDIVAYLMKYDENGAPKAK